MLKKILIGLLILVLLIGIIGGYLYWKFLQDNKPSISTEDRAVLTLMPLPAKAAFEKGEFEIKPDITLGWKGYTEERLENAVKRLFHQISINPTYGDEGAFEIICDSTSSPIQQETENESYTLSVSSNKLTLHAASPYGVLRGLETLRQLIISREGKYFIPAITIEDKPRYPWRGILMDASRHWISKEAILRNLDLMAATKLNVLHWHLTDYQGFRVESKIFPKLHELGSEGHYYAQEDISEIIAYAYDRGIRVVPEFDMPGHATSWFVGYPELATKPGPYELDTKFGVLTPIMDPTKEEVYTFLDKFISEMAALFPDPYLHIGGDEVSAEDWNASEPVQEFMKSKGLKDEHDLQHYFNTRVKAILTKHGKKMIGWDEILHPDLGADVMVQSWRSHKSLFEAVQKGSPAILSAGFYLDHKLPASKHYQVDPEILPGAITITPDSIHWQQYNLKLQVSEDPMETMMILYGQNENLRGAFSMLDNNIGFENAIQANNDLTFTFTSDFGEIDVKATLLGDSISGKMSLGLLSFPFTGHKAGGHDVEGTKPPKVEKIKPLTSEEKTRIKGGEAALWTELITEKNIDSRLWPRAAAIAEKLWSPAALTKDVDDLYRRLDFISDNLSARGSLHIVNQESMLKEIAGDKPIEILQVLTEPLEEVKYYNRMAMYKETLSTRSPLNEVVDAVQPESYSAYKLSKMVDRYIADSTHQINSEDITKILKRYADNDETFKTMAVGNSKLEKVLILSSNLKEASDIGLDAIRNMNSNKTIPDDQTKMIRERLAELEKAQEGIIIAILPSIRKLVDHSSK